MIHNKRRFTHSQIAFIALCLITIFATSGVAVFNTLGNPSPYEAKGDHIIYIVPHIHLDPNWLDPWQTEANRWSTNVRSALDLMALQPSLCLVLDQEVAIKYFWEHYPEYQSAMLQYIQEGRLEIVEGFVDQPDMNLPSEEGLIEDAQIGTEWCRTTLGANITTGWELDPFGYGIGTPTFFHDCGLNDLVITRSALNMENGLFQWTGDDNSSILGFYVPTYCMCPGDDGYTTEANLQNINAFYDYVFSMINPSSPNFQQSINPDNLANDQGNMMMLYGCDFTNANPSLVTWVAAWNALYAQQTGYVCQIGTPAEYFASIQPLLNQGGKVGQIIPPTEDMNPVFNGGYYTTHSAMKQDAQQFEDRLTGEETFASIAKQVLPNYRYPQDDLLTAWNALTVNYHHDTITGTSYLPVYEDEMQLFNQEFPTLDQLDANIFGNLSTNMQLTNSNPQVIPLTVFNPSSWNRTDVIAYNMTLNLPFIVDVNVWDPDTGKVTPSQIIPLENSSTDTLQTFTILFTGTIPSMGYKTYYIEPLTTPNPNPPSTDLITTENSNSNITLENSYYRISFNATGTNQLQIFDKNLNWEVLNQSMPGWELYEYYDKGDQYSYGFNGIEANVTAQLPTVSLIENGPARAQLQFQYQVGNSIYNRTISLYDGLHRIDVDEEMNFEPPASTALNFRWEFNITQPTYVSGEQFGTIIENPPKTANLGPFPFPFNQIPADSVFPAMYYVNAENSTYSASVITAAIHGFRIENNTLEGIMVRDLQTNKTDTNTNNCPDNGTWDFRYCLTTFDPTNQTAAINQQQLAYQFNFRMFTYQGTLHNGSLPAETSFYTVNSPGVIIQGLRKDYSTNNFCFQAENLVNSSTVFNITSNWNGIGNASLANFLNEPTGNCNFLDDAMELTLSAYSWQTVLFTSAINGSTEIVNGPSVSSPTISNIWNGPSLTISVQVTDNEGASIQNVWLQYSYNETLQGQTWTSIPMVAQSDGNYVVTVPLSTFSERPIYFRVCAEDNCSNFGYSLAETDVRQPEFTTFTIIMSILIIIAGLIIGLWSIRRHYKGHVKEDSIRIKTVKKSLGFGGWISLGNAVWIFNWMMIKGFFGNPNITSIFPGSTVPNIGAAYSWSMNLQNSIIDFFTVDFFLGTLIINVCITLLWMIYHKQRLKIVDLIFGILGMFLFPLIGIIILPISFLVAGAPIGDYSQIFYAVGFLYSCLSTETLPLIYWYIMPIFIGGLIIFVGTELAIWIWSAVLPNNARDRVKAKIFQWKEFWIHRKTSREPSSDEIKESLGGEE